MNLTCFPWIRTHLVGTIEEADADEIRALDASLANLPWQPKPAVGTPGLRGAPGHVGSVGRSVQCRTSNSA